MLTVVPFAIIPVAPARPPRFVLVNVFPARRARDILMLMGLLFAASIVMLIRYIRPERLLRVESLPDITGFFATLQSPITPLLPSFWAGGDAVCQPAGRPRLAAPRRAVDDGAGIDAAAARGARAVAFQRLQQRAGGPKARFTKLRSLDALARALPLSAVSPAPAGQGREDLPSRRQPVVAAPAARSRWC